LERIEQCSVCTPAAAMQYLALVVWEIALDVSAVVPIGV